MWQDEKGLSNVLTILMAEACDDAHVAIRLDDDLPELRFRRLCIDDLETIRCAASAAVLLAALTRVRARRSLHEEWFPVRYSAAFFDAAVRARPPASAVARAQPLNRLSSA